MSPADAGAAAGPPLRARLGLPRLLRRAAAGLLAASLGLGPAAPAQPAGAARPLARLPALGLAADGVTLSGLSSGAYMAGQFQVAHAASLAGAALLAGGPYGCSRGSVSTAMYQCSCPAHPDAVQRLRNLIPGAGCSVLAPGALAVFADAALLANQGAIDDPSQLARHRVWLFSGGHDQVVVPALVEAAQAFYHRHGVPAAQLHHERVANAGHGLPTPDGPVACALTATPYLLRCPGQDAAGELLAWLYGATPGAPLMPPVAARLGAAQGAGHTGLQRFSQQPYRQAGVFDGLDDSGWLYLPAACAAGPGAATCRLHVVFHGCLQGQSASGPGGRAIGAQFVAGAGYNRWAEANRIVLLYPQVRASQAARPGASFQLNPEGCWDFWGYTDPAESLGGPQRRFATRQAPQVAAVKRMVDDLLRR